MSFMNKHCDEIRELLAAYSMGATDPEETALVERHLPDCPEAVAELAEYLALINSGRILGDQMDFLRKSFKSNSRLLH